MIIFYLDDEVMRLRKVFLLLDTDHSGEMDIEGNFIYLKPLPDIKMKRL